jgi:hypothetical protein
MKNLLSSSFLCSSRLQRLHSQKKYLKKMSTSTLHRNFHTSQFLSFTLSLQLLFPPQVHSHKHHSRHSPPVARGFDFFFFFFRSFVRSFVLFFFFFRSFFSSLSKSFYRFFSSFFSLLSFHFLSREWLRCCRAAGEMDNGLKV